MKAKKLRRLVRLTPATPSMLEHRDTASAQLRAKLLPGPPPQLQQAALDLWRDAWLGIGGRRMDAQRMTYLMNLGAGLSGMPSIAPYKVMTRSDARPQQIGRPAPVRRIRSINNAEKARVHFSSAWERFF